MIISEGDFIVLASILGVIFIIFMIITQCVDKKAFDKLVFVIIYLTVQPIIKAQGIQFKKFRISVAAEI